ncbi:MAG: hypothetical protein RQ715_06225 [Methylococcales bacterium]|nr:hypothetical protein [Methylococcales bacterium]
MTTLPPPRYQQRGFATTLIALILLIGITLVVLTSSKTILTETQMSANQYRDTQAEAAASAAMDRGIAYFMAGGIDQIDNSTGLSGADNQVDFSAPDATQQPTEASCAMPATPAAPVTLTASGQTNLALFYYDITSGNACDCQPGMNCFNATIFGAIPTKRAMIVARGWSDDCSAVRTTFQCLDSFAILNGGGPKQPFVLKAGVAAFGNATIVNRYNNSSIWSGSIPDTSSAAFGTYLRPSNTRITDYDKEDLDDPDETQNTQKVSDRNAGAGIDVIGNDPNLASLTNKDFFDLFFALSKGEIRSMADDLNQLYNAGTTPPNTVTGLVWVGPLNAPSTTTTSIGGAGTTIGSPNVPVIMIVNGDLKITGGQVHGVIFVAGELSITGNPVVKGSIISNAVNNGSGGTLKLVYVPLGDSTVDDPFIPGTGAIVAGSWRDWTP